MKRINLIALLSLSIGASACGTNDEAIAPVAGSNKLKQVLNAQEFEQSYKQSLIDFYENQTFSAYYTDDVLEGGDVESSASSTTDSSSGSGASITSTNLQEQGVDEADRIKTDGQSLYVLEARTYNYYNSSSSEAVSTSQPYHPDVSDTGNKIKIFQLNPDEIDLELTSEVDLNLEDRMLADGLFLYDEGEKNSLAVMASSGSGYYGWYDSYAWSAESTSISLVDVTDPSEAQVINSIIVEGRAISSRRIGDHLLVASRFHPEIDNIYYYPQTDEEKARNESLINDLSLSDLMPKVTDQNGQSIQLSSTGDCFVQDAESQSAFVADVISLYTVDLNDLSISSSLCYVGASETFYASTDAVYLATTRYQWQMEQADIVNFQSSTVETDLHQFSFDNGKLTYQASGSVDGHLGWNVKQRPFRLSAKNGDLRVVSYTAELTPEESPVKLSVLRKSGSELALISSLPNAEHPEPLGKPGESLYASRFVGDKAYFVTFRTTDPLYVIDLSNPNDPKKLGELFVDGYSDYLHPVGENLLIGIGKDAIADQSSGDGRGAWYQGVKLSLIDVEDPTNPLEVDKLVFGQRGSESTALYNHHAFTFLSAEQTGASGRLVFPLQINSGLTTGSSSAPWEWHDWKATGLQLVNVDEVNKTFSRQGFIQVASPNSEQYAPNIFNDGAVLFDDAIYYVQENDVYASGWLSQELVNGPR